MRFKIWLEQADHNYNSDHRIEHEAFEFGNIYYHVTSKKNQNSIEKYGLDPNHFDRDRSTEGNWVYVFKTLESARWYRDYMEIQPPIEKMQIWKINAKGLEVKKDYSLSSNEEENDAYMIKTPIEKNRLLLL